MKKLAALALCLGSVLPTSAFAVEGGTGAYLLGSRGLAAGYVPPAGVYVTDSLVYLQSGTKESISIGGAILAEPTIDALVNLFGLTAVADTEIFGGSAAINVTVPYADVKADFNGRFLAGTTQGTIKDSQNGLGDISITPILGWHDGYWNYSLSGTMYLPTGEYSTAVVKPHQGVFDVLSISKNRFAFDPTVAVTYLNPNSGFEANGALGVTFSARNKATDYQTAPELHLEAAIGQHLANGLVLGLAGYGYQQLANDSGSGAKAFQAAVGAKSLQARVFGAGPILGYATNVGGVGVNLQAKYFTEFGVKRRLKSDVFWLTAGLAF